MADISCNDVRLLSVVNVILFTNITQVKRRKSLLIRLTDCEVLNNI